MLAYKLQYCLIASRYSRDRDTRRETYFDYSIAADSFHRRTVKEVATEQILGYHREKIFTALTTLFD